MSHGGRLPLRWLERLRRSVAVACAALVLALTVFAASPLAHGCLHDPDTGLAGDHGCAVTLFAAGIAPSLGYVAIAPPPLQRHALARLSHDAVLLVTPRYLRQPERGPPLD